MQAMSGLPTARCCLCRKDVSNRSPRGAKLKLGLRAEDIVPVGHGQAPQRSWNFDAKVLFSEPLGSETLLIAELGGQECVAKMFNPVPVTSGRNVSFQLNVQRMHLFDAQAGVSLAITSH